MRMLAPEEESDDAPEVTWEDQQKINTFSKLNARLRGIEDAHQKLKEDKEVLDDLSMELELADEEDLVLYRVGEAFLHLPLTEAQERLEQDQRTISSELERMQKKVDECEVTMKELKIELYTKFGSSINLDA